MRWPFSILRTHNGRWGKGWLGGFGRHEVSRPERPRCLTRPPAGAHPLHCDGEGRTSPLSASEDGGLIAEDFVACGEVICV